MPVVIDSDVLIEVSRSRNEQVVTLWKQLMSSDELILCSPVSVAELWHGVRPREEKILNALFGALQCVAIDEQIGRRAGQYMRDFSKSHAVELGDALIAATSSLFNAELWTRNHRHYPMKDVRFYEL